MAIKLRQVRITRDSPVAEAMARYEDEIAGFVAKHAVQLADLEQMLAQTDLLGRFPLWEGYSALKSYGKRAYAAVPDRQMSQVRADRNMCQFLTWLVVQLKPDAVLEFGAAFGASGAYVLAGMEAAGTGHLFSFEPNAEWAGLARENFDKISTRHSLTVGTFEENLQGIDREVAVTFIDAIHTPEHVLRQLELVRAVSAPGAVVIFDDVNFSDDMKRCWQEIERDKGTVNSWRLGYRAGMIEL